MNTIHNTKTIFSDGFAGRGGERQHGTSYRYNVGGGEEAPGGR